MVRAGGRMWAQKGPPAGIKQLPLDKQEKLVRRAIRAKDKLKFLGKGFGALPKPLHRAWGALRCDAVVSRSVGRSVGRSVSQAVS